MTGRENLAIVSFIAGCQSRESVFMVLSKRSQYTLRNQLTGRQRDAINSIHEYLRLSRKSVRIKLEVEGKTSVVLWQKNISKQ